MIKSFRHNGLKRFYSTDHTSGIQPEHAKKLRMQLVALDSATSVEDIGISRQLASSLGVSPSTLSRLLKGDSGISPEMSLRLSKVLGRTCAGAPARRKAKG